MSGDTSAKRKAVAMDSSSADEAPTALKLCTLCFPSAKDDSTPWRLCSHMMDPENRLFYQLTAMKQWNHNQAREAIQAYSEFMTLKMVQQDYDATILSPTHVMNEVWHAHVLDTKSYQSFHTRYLHDGQLIHHDPLKAMDTTTHRNRCNNTIQVYESYFRRPLPQCNSSWSYDATAVADETTDLSQVLVMNNRGNMSTMDAKTNPKVDSDTTVLDPKRKITTATATDNVPESEQRLAFRGKQLDDDDRPLHGNLSPTVTGADSAVSDGALNYSEEDEDSRYDPVVSSSVSFDIVTVTGAGVDDVNGDYYLDGSHDGVKKFRKVSRIQDREQVFTLYRCAHSNRSKHWYISIVPVDIAPGTNKDIDFYSARATGYKDEMPPTGNWSIKQHGRAPPPKIWQSTIVYSSDVINTISKTLGTVILRDQTGEETYFKVDFERTKFLHIARVYAERKDMNVQQLRFLFKGDIINLPYNARVGSFLQDGDQVDAVLAQTGC